MSTASQPHALSSSTPSKAALWSGRVLSALTVLFMLFDAFGKFAKPVQVTDAFTRLGLPIATSVTIGVLITVCTLLYAIPRTAVLGAVLLTGFLGGAIAIQLRAGSPTFETWFPVIFATIAWLGIYLRYPALKAVLPLC
jgi:hypothetical protein